MTYSRLQKTINKLLERANESVLDSDWESIKEDAENVLSLDSSNEEAKILLDLANKNIVIPQANKKQKNKKSVYDGHHDEDQDDPWKFSF